ncbi:MAG TPA: FAD-dependent monooxygenase [Steroidobacteraceae bacterium]|nr:FAD-dependent monooxygenase [Steroidobacteraceae bacterium]
MEEERVSVLIVGAGLAGLSAALTLSLRGKPPLVVERHPGFSRHPRARGLNIRSMELLRAAGIERELCTQSSGTFGDFTVVHAESVTGPVRRTIVQRGAWEVGLSPARSSGMVQSAVEPILKRRAEQLGAEVRFGTELLALSEESGQVRAVLKERASGREYTVLAEHLIGADGHRSAVRSLLGVGTTGSGTLSSHIAVVFTAERELPGHSIYYLRQENFTAAFIHMDDSGLSVLSVEMPEGAQAPLDLSQERCLAYLGRGLGLAPQGIRILDVMRYDMASLLADRISTERVHLIGDAAHTMPPIGGLGGQAAIQDGFDIGWKLDLALRGRAGPALVQSYATERGPVGELTVSHQTNKYFQRMRPEKAAGSPAQDERLALSVAYGYRYRSSCVSVEQPDDGAPFEDPSALSGRPGTRVPHVPLERDGQATSVLDNIGGDFLLVAGPQGHGWVTAASKLKDEFDVPLSSLHISTDVVDPEGTWTDRHGIAEDGAILVRPDGFVAWRAKELELDPYATLRRGLGVALGRAPPAAEGNETESKSS